MFKTDIVLHLSKLLPPEDGWVRSINDYSEYEWKSIKEEAVEVSLTYDRSNAENVIDVWVGDIRYSLIWGGLGDFGIFQSLIDEQLTVPCYVEIYPDTKDGNVPKTSLKVGETYRLDKKIITEFVSIVT